MNKVKSGFCRIRLIKIQLRLIKVNAVFRDSFFLKFVLIMKKHSKYTFLVLLMIFSQVLLSVIVIQWLRLQWQNEKASFESELSLAFKSSVSSMIDSMLMKNIIEPALMESVTRPEIITGKKIPESTGGETKSHTETGIGNLGNIKSRKDLSSVTAFRRDQTSVGRSKSAPIDTAETNLLLESVRLFVDQTRDSLSEGSHLMHIISNNPDTNLLKRVFINKIESAGYRLNVKWISNFKRSHNEKPVYFESSLFVKPFGVLIQGYQKFVLLNMTGQIIFGLILLVFTAIAFWVTGRSMMKMTVLNNLRNDFIRNITHELKTPVSTVSIALEALTNYNRLQNTKKYEEYLEIASNEIKRLDQLITQVLNASVVERKELFFEIQDCDLVELVREVLDSMTMRFQDMHATVNYHSDCESCILMIDRLHIQGVLLNLLDNSLKYSDNEPIINVNIKRGHTAALLIVSDNGPGIPKEYISKVFEKFFRVPSGDRHDVKGYGLGLYYSKMVMEQHSGSIGVKNKNEGGCEFRLTFPVNNK